MPYKLISNRNKYYKEHSRTLIGRYSSLKRHAKQRGFGVKISFEKWKELVECPCHYCNGTLPEAGAGLDRIDSKEGYVLGNVVPCCTICNVAKGTMSYTAFKDWVSQIYHYWIGLDY